MTNFREQVRQVLTARIEALRVQWVEYALKVEYDNANSINLATQSDPFLCVSIVYQDGYQISLGRDSASRVLGTIVLEAKVKVGSGTAQANRLLEHFFPALHMTDSMPPLRTYAARFSSDSVKSGWVAQAALIPFWFDTV